MQLDELCWEVFGLPDAAFLPAWKPAEGLKKALAERKLPFAEKWEPETIAKTEYCTQLADRPGGQSFCRAFDAELKPVAERYLNHTKLADEKLAELTEIPHWTWDELTLAAADGQKEAIADPEKGDLSPEWNLEWARQRQKAINLLLYAPIPFLYDFVSGSTHDGKPKSPAASLKSALKNAEPRSSSGLPASYVENIYGPDHGWDEGTYCCNVSIVKKLYADPPEGFPKPGSIVLLLKVTGSDGTEQSFSGEGLTLGMNQFTADDQGEFANFPSSSVGSGIPSPTEDHPTSGGWKATLCEAFADCTELFHFKDESTGEEGGK